MSPAPRRVAAPLIGAVALLIALAPATPVSAQGFAKVIDRITNPPPPFAPAVDAALRDNRVGGLTLREYLVTLDFEGCLDSVREELVVGLDALRTVHVGAMENRRQQVVWRVWDRKLDGLSPDAMLLVTTWLDSPDTASRLYLCDDGLPPSWKKLSPDAYVIEAVTWFDFAIAEREHTLRKGTTGDREQTVMELIELREALLDRFETTYPSTSETDEALARLDGRINMMWDTLVEPHDFGFTPRARVADASSPADATRRTRVENPFAGGIGIPDPRDVAMRDRVTASWRRQRQTIDREIADRQARLDEAVAAVDSATDPDELDRLVRVALRLDAELAQSVADLERMQTRVRLLSTGRPWVDGMLSNGRRRRAVRRLDRRQGGVQQQRTEVVALMDEAVRRGATPPGVQRGGTGSPSRSGGGRVTDRQQPGVGNWLAGLPVPEDAAPTTTAADTIAPGTGWVERIYEGPLPSPSAVWSDDLVSAIRSRYATLDDADVRILLGLVREAYRELKTRGEVEAAVWRSLGADKGLKIRGEESTLSDLYLPGAARADQPIVTFVLTLYF